MSALIFHVGTDHAQRPHVFVERAMIGGIVAGTKSGSVKNRKVALFDRSSQH